MFKPKYLNILEKFQMGDVIKIDLNFWGWIQTYVGKKGKSCSHHFNSTNFPLLISVLNKIGCKVMNVFRKQVISNPTQQLLASY